jgi:outer membrane protein
MSVAERQRQESDLRQMRREIRRLEDEFREDVNLRRSQELGKLQRLVVEVIQKLAKAEKFDLIISDGVIYAGDTVDITDKVIARLKQGN